MLIHIKTQQEYNDLISKGLVLVDFFANWCGPCRMLTPVLEEISEEDASLNILKVNVDELPSIASDYGVMAIPALFLIKEGKVINAAKGFLPKDQLINFINVGK